jgi:hypothetical protein
VIEILGSQPFIADTFTKRHNYFSQNKWQDKRPLNKRLKYRNEADVIFCISGQSSLHLRSVFSWPWPLFVYSIYGVYLDIPTGRLSAVCFAYMKYSATAAAQIIITERVTIWWAVTAKVRDPCAITRNIHGQYARSGEYEGIHRMINQISLNLVRVVNSLRTCTIASVLRMKGPS